MSCVVRGCKSRVRTKEIEPYNISFHRLPKLSSPAREEWLNFICRMKRDWCWIPRKSSRVCSKHFSADSFIMKRDKRVFLKENAVPTTILPSTGEIADTNRSPDDEAKPVHVNESKIELVPPATSTTEPPPILIVKTESLSDRAVEPEMVPSASINVKTAPLSNRVLKPIMVSRAATVTTALPHRLKIKMVPLSNPFIKPILIPRASVTRVLPHSLNVKTVLKPKMVLPATTVTSAPPDPLKVEETVPLPNHVYQPEMVLIPTSPTHSDDTEPGSNNQLIQIIVKLERNVSRLEKLASKRLLLINSLKQRVRRLEKKVKVI